jgi:hypothetical protein
VTLQRLGVHRGLRSGVGELGHSARNDRPVMRAPVIRSPAPATYFTARKYRPRPRRGTFSRGAQTAQQAYGLCSPSWGKSHSAAGE